MTLLVLCGCQNLVTQKMAAQDAMRESKEIYISCLRSNDGDEQRCSLEKKIFEANVLANQSTGNDANSVLVQGAK